MSRTIPIYQVDAFTGRLFAGNPAAVCPLEEWLEDSVLQSIAAENNLSETAFFVPKGDGYHLRWMTPEIEVDLCGHATLATAFVIFHYLDPAKDSVTFETKSGRLVVRRDGDLLTMDFPARPPVPCEMPAGLAEALGKRPLAVLASRDLIALYENEEDVRSLAPNVERLAGIDWFAVIATAPGREADFVSRFFAPRAGIAEDSVTGSAHCSLVPYWSRRLNKTRLHAFQLSARGGELWCEDQGERVRIAGKAVKFMEGRIYL